MSRSRSRSPIARREHSYSPPRERRAYYSPPRGRALPERDYDRGYERDYDRGGYERDSYYDRGYSERDSYYGGGRGGYGGGERDYYGGGGGRGGGYHNHERSYGAPSYNRRPRSPPRKRPVFKGEETDRMTSKCLFVGNMPYSFREEEVMELFDKCGKIVSVSVPMDRYTGRNKGFAFVTFEERADAEDAKARFESYQVEGRTLRIDWDVGREKKFVEPPARDDQLPPPIDN